MNSKKWIMAVLVFCFAALTNSAMAQDDWNQNTACPGWYKPTSFTAGNSQCYYRGELGAVADKSQRPMPSPLTGETGIKWSGTIINASQLSNQGVSGCGGSSNGLIPNHDRQFAIMNTNSTASGHPTNKDPNTGDMLPFVPTHFNTNDPTPGFVNTQLTHSIRIGDDCSAGSSSGSGSTWPVWVPSSYQGATALYYYITPNVNNAMLILYYAIVIEAPTHTVLINPWFIIRVQYNAGTASNPNWRQVSPTGTFTSPTATQMCDTLSYMVSSSLASEGGNVVMAPSGGVGWHQYGSGYNRVYYKDWEKVVINLGGLLYQQVRVEVMVADCGYNAHYGYGYVTGECRPMSLTGTGCPAGRDTVVTTLRAPRGMKRYQWSVSEFGASDPAQDNLSRGGRDAYFTFRNVRMADGTFAEGPEDTVIVRSNGRRDTIRYSNYDVKSSDFRVLYRPNSAHQQIRPVDSLGHVIDSFGNRQTFRCRMKSALDPAKPFYTNLYLSVDNQKPSMAIGKTLTCDGKVKTWNESEVPGAPMLVNDSLTRWAYYSDSLCRGTVIDSGRGDSLIHQFNDTTLRYLLVRTYNVDTTCYSEAVYKIKPISRPKKAGIKLSRKVLCDADQTTITDTTPNVMYREWYLLNEEGDGYDTIRGAFDRVNNPPHSTVQQSFSRSFTHSIEPIRLRVLNGLYSVNLENTQDTNWCDTVVSDMVAVFVHPELTVTGDTIVCQGSKTDATVNAVGVPGCTYEWSLTNGTVSGGFGISNRLQVEPYADTSVYYVKVTSPQGCTAWDSIYAYLVRPQLDMTPRSRICPGDTAVLTGSNADHYSWVASPADPSLAGQETNDVIYVTPSRTTTYTMIGHGSNNCDASPLTETVTVVPMPVPNVVLDPGYIDNEDPTIVLADRSSNSASTEWRFEDGQVVEGKVIQHTFDGIDQDSAVHVVLTTANEIGCSIDYPFAIPVYIYTAWLPNSFTPGSEDQNAVFKLYTNNAYEYFHIYIYNRNGLLVFESDDPKFEWDGTRNGTPCPQGAYVYVCNYRKPEAKTLSSRHGSLTLLR
ncbi:MAG: gliding motility-associated C-terminal domain-containing protein [Bacteroidales bacterium]|nr:gliding motility-associated C-terminal domain-containing protein [Bacteroidales bacterium]